MAAPFVALGLKAVNFAADKYHDKIYDKITKPKTSSNDSLAKNTSPNDSDSASVEYSDDGFIEERRAGRRRGRRGTSDGLGEREYAGQWSGYENARSYAAPQFEGDVSGPWAQNLYPQPPYQASTYMPPDPRQYQTPYTPSTSASPVPEPAPSHRPPPSDRRRSYSLSSAPPRSRHKSKPSDDVDMTSGVIGALAGGLVGSQLGHGQALPAVVAAALGAVGANRLEKRQRRKEKGRLER